MTVHAKVEMRNDGGSWIKSGSDVSSPSFPRRKRKINLPSRRLLRSLRAKTSRARLNRGGAPISIRRAEQGRGGEGILFCGFIFQHQ
uniref:Uncharacterized protein n=1 Tax=Oryza glumipatula TaxID=40148 RepID=A0A0D9YNW9_9ORYZ